MKDYSKEEFVHYGACEFDRTKFRKIRNRTTPHCKPVHGTGLWSSPVDTSYGWRHWCAEEDYKSYEKENFFTFRLADDARLYVIDTLHDLEALPNLGDKNAGWFSLGLNFVKIAEKYDAIFLTEYGQQRTRLSEPINLYGWDCECILVLNADVIVQKQVFREMEVKKEKYRVRKHKTLIP